MNRVIAAVDNSAAARPVLSAAAAVGRLFAAGLEAVHVRERGRPGTTTAEAAAAAAGVELEVLEGETVARLIEVGGRPDVVAVVLGVRGTPGGKRPAGHVAIEVATSVPKPVVAVPPQCACPVRLQRILVPLERDMATAAGLREVIEAAGAAGAEIVLLHVFEERNLPLFTEQPQHEVDAWVGEFVRRYCHYLGRVRVELRAGVPAEQLLSVAEEIEADAVVLGWGQRLATGRAAVVRNALAGSRLPVILVPVPRAASVVLASADAEVRGTSGRT
ncbi:MAG TPA: universal stress protein [Candidatus Dormibacteraeota bacterium]|nr:universal stress protein [Candidatus Dormibacteraeota bacterium]